MSLTRLFLIPFLTCIFVLGCGKQPEAPNTQVAPKVSSTNPQPKQASLPPSVSVPVFTLQDFDSNSTDHNSTKKAIGEALGKSPAELTQADLEQVEKLDLFALGITDISPLAALSRLKRLNIVGNNINDLTALTGLTSLEVLYACENKISDITPLAGLSKLRVLHLRKNFVSDLTPLAGLTSMLSLDLERNRVRDIDVFLSVHQLFSSWCIYKNHLANMHDLNWLALSFNQVSDISALAGTQNLRHLYLERNRLTNESDISAFSKLCFLKTLSIRDNRVTDLSSLAGSDKMLWLELDNNRVYDLSPLAGMKGLKKLYMENNQVRILDPLVKLTSLEIVRGRGNPVSSKETRKLMQALPKCSIKVGSFNKVPTRRNQNPAPPEKN